MLTVQTSFRYFQSDFQRKNRLKKEAKTNKKDFLKLKVNNELKNPRLAWCENPRQNNNDGFAAYGQGEKR